MSFLDILVQHVGAKLLYDKLMLDGWNDYLKKDASSNILTAFAWGPVTVQILKDGEQFGYKLILPEMGDYESLLNFADPEGAAARALLHIRKLREQAQKQAQQT